MDSEERSVQDIEEETRDIGNLEPWKSEEVNAAGSEGVGDEDVGSVLKSRDSGVARCECEHSVTREETCHGVASGVFHGGPDLGAEEPTENAFNGTDSVKETCVVET